MIENYVGYMGSGSPRFYLSLDQTLPAASVAQFVVLTRNVKERETGAWLVDGDPGAGISRQCVLACRDWKTVRLWGIRFSCVFPESIFPRCVSWLVGWL